MRKPVLIGVGLGLGLLLVLAAVAARSSLAPDLLPRLSGSAAWLTSRAAGVAAFLALSLDVAFGLFVSTGIADAAIPRARSVETHRFLSTVALGATAAHVLALLLDGFVRFDALDILVPFFSTYRPIAVGVGGIAAYLLVLVHLSFSWRARLGAKVWRAFHYASFAVYVGVLVHGLAAGSDAGALASVYVGSGTIVAALLLYRVALFGRRTAARRS